MSVEPELDRQRATCQQRVPAPLLMGAVRVGGLGACRMYAVGVSSVVLIARPIMIAGVIGAEFDVLSSITTK